MRRCLTCIRSLLSVQLPLLRLGCISIKLSSCLFAVDETVPDMYLIITKCTAILAQIRRLDNKDELGMGTCQAQSHQL